MGRPSKLTPELQATIVGLIKAGNYKETTCAIVGIARSTLYEWMRRGQLSDQENEYTRFHDEVVKALAWAEARDVAILNQHAEKDPRAARWKLERRFPERWGPGSSGQSEDFLEIPGEDSGKKGDGSNFTPEQVRIIKKALAIAAWMEKENKGVK